MNFLVITIDALSKWYIDQYKREDGFFSRLERECLSMQNLYSTGPFTEAAIRGLWAGVEPLSGSSYLAETFFDKETIFERFSNLNYYMYYGRLIPYFHHHVQVENTNMEREKCEERAFEHIWNNRLKYYIQINHSGNLKADEYWKMQFVLDEFFGKYDLTEMVSREGEKYNEDKLVYIKDILDNAEKSSFYKMFANDLNEVCTYKHINDYKNQIKHPVSEKEALFLKKAKNKNIEYLLKCNSEYIDVINKELGGTRNRCINSNNDLLSHMRDESEILPRLKEEIDDFIKWYDETGKNLKKSYFAYIHNYDFHYPECFVNARYEDLEAYELEVEELCNCVDKLECKKMSVSKQLCLINIEKNIEYLWNELERRNIFENTCIIIAADHGISNFLYSIDPSENRWNYTRTNFNVPMYMKVPGIKPSKIETLTSAKFFPMLLRNIEQGQKNIDENTFLNKSEDYIFTAWVNGVPDLERNAIKIGIRNNKYSITCEGLFTQLFASLKVTGIFDLEKDPDEIHSIRGDKSQELGLLALYSILKDKWIEVVLQIINESDERYGFRKKYEYLLNDIQRYKSWNMAEKISQAEVLKIINEKNVYIFGRGERAKNFLERYSSNCKVVEVWDNYIGENDYYFGHKICYPHKVDNENTLILICSRYEIDIINKLEALGNNHYITYDSIY